jgi:non-ribosomal peptide synthetase component F
MILRGPDRPDLLRNECLADILRATAQQHPNKPALIWGERVVTYSKLDALSNSIGSALAKRGAEPGAVIGLFMPRGADLLIAQAGITKSGAAWLPFDAETPIERIALCLKSAKAIGIVTCKEWLPLLKNNVSVPVWAVVEGTLGPFIIGDAPAETVEPLRAQLSHPAYVIYTSGSTGEPKGIVISQRGICHFLRAENEWLGVTAEDKVYQGFSVAFDMSFEDIWTPIPRHWRPHWRARASRSCMRCRH